jgi:HK97 family phage major capsid protein
VPYPDLTRSQILIPDQYALEIIQNTVEQSAVLGLCRSVNMGTGTLKMPVLAALPSGGWVTPRDVGQKKLTSAQWSNVVLTAEELAGILIVPESVINDAAWDIFGELKPRMAEHFGALIDLAVLFGVDDTGAAVPATFPTGGVIAHATAAGNTVLQGHIAGPPAQDIAGDISEVMATVEDDGFEVDGWVARTQIKARLRGLRTTQNALLFQPSLQAATPDTLYGLPMRYARNGGWDSDDPAQLVVGDWDNAIIGLRQDITFKVMTEATFTDGAGAVVVSLAETDQVALRVVMRVGFAIANPITQLNPDGTTRSPFGVLHTA